MSSFSWKEKYLDYYFSEESRKAFLAKELLKKNHPKSLYHYRRGTYTENDEENYDLKNLINHVMRICSPDQFNDPYDCAICIDAYSLHKSLLQTYRENLKTPSFMYPIGDLILEEELPTRERILDGISEHYRKHLCIGCLSEKKNSLLMWSHYSNNHQGFCIEYDFDSLLFSLPPQTELFPVVYSNEFPDLTQAIIEKNHSAASMSFIRKAKDWSYEYEWRLLHINPTVKANHQYIPTPLPKSIYLGCKVSTKLKSNILKICHEQNISLFQMNMKKNCFMLESSCLYVKTK